jgi:2-phospho-L-lactate guanylyltransferase
MSATVGLLVPVKTWATAKSRLDGHVDRRDLMRAFARDALEAALACPAVAVVYVVSDEPETATWGATVLPDEGDGDLNRALAAAARRVGDTHLQLAAMCADLPCLRTDDLTAALTSAAGGRHVVADADGTGTTLLVAGPHADLEPAFGAGSAARHEGSGAVPLRAELASLRRDVDTAADLRAAMALGVGPHTAALLGFPNQT